MFFSHHDMRHLWEEYNTIRVREDSVARARCGMEGIVRTERVFIGSSVGDDDDEVDETRDRRYDMERSVWTGPGRSAWCVVVLVETLVSVENK